MPAVILKRILFKIAGVVGLGCLAVALTSCATKESPPLVADPAAANETAMPWNQQEKWEREGQASVLTQQRR